MSVVNYKLGPWWPDDYGDSRTGRAKTKAKARDKRAWKKEVEEEMSSATTTVYIVRNFWTPAGGDFELLEDCHASFSQDGAWDVLNSLAEGQGVALGMNDWSFECAPDRHTEREYYAIVTMEVYD